jgi:hypothetical protein
MAVAARARAGGAVFTIFVRYWSLDTPRTRHTGH